MPEFPHFLIGKDVDGIFFERFCPNEFDTSLDFKESIGLRPSISHRVTSNADSQIVGKIG